MRWYLRLGRREEIEERGDVCSRGPAQTIDNNLRQFSRAFIAGRGSRGSGRTHSWKGSQCGAFS